MTPDLKPDPLSLDLALRDSDESHNDHTVYYIDIDDEYTDTARLQNQIFDLVRG